MHERSSGLGVKYCPYSGPLDDVGLAAEPKTAGQAFRKSARGPSNVACNVMKRINAS